MENQVTSCHVMKGPDRVPITIGGLELSHRRVGRGRAFRRLLHDFRGGRDSPRIDMNGDSAQGERRKAVPRPLGLVTAIPAQQMTFSAQTTRVGWFQKRDMEVTGSRGT